MCQPRWWGEREQMHALLRPAGDQMYDTRAWRGPAVVGGDGIDRRYPLSQRNTPQAVEDFCFCALAPLRHADGPRLSLLVTQSRPIGNAIARPLWLTCCSATGGRSASLPPTDILMTGASVAR